MTLDIERLRASLLSEPSAGHFVQEDGLEDQPLTPAAVLFPIVLGEAGQTVLLTQRTAHLRDHAGQISFPGGRVEADDPSPIHTALRERKRKSACRASASMSLASCRSTGPVADFV